MSALPLSPLPTSTTDPSPGPPPAAKPWLDVFPKPSVQNEPIERSALPAWPQWQAAAPVFPPIQAPQLSPLPAAKPPIEIPANFTPAFRPIPSEAPPFTFQASTPPPPPPAPDFTDEDLREALAPFFKEASFAAPNRSDAQLEPMLRATVRRALAEYSPGSRPFQPPGVIDRFLWRMQALFSSRSYEDILFEKTHRFQVEEVFLLDSATLALVSYASSNPARHSSARRVESTVQRLAVQLRDADGKIRPSFKLQDDRNVVSREGKFITLLAIVRGKPSEMALSDLAFSIERIEDRFRERFQTNGSPLLQVLQPFLEDCLLIQAPASAA